jgi:taurine dioxygenase
MTSFRKIEVRPLAGALGAEIGGVDLKRVDDQTFTEIQVAWLEYLVIFFRDQNIKPDEQIAFAKRFGAIHYHPFMKGMEEHPEILEIIKEEGDTKAFGETWHTDQMFNPKPAKPTILYARETPAVGGDTLFANMHLAYETLSAPMKSHDPERKDLERWRPQETEPRRQHGLDARRALRRQRKDGSQGS